MNSLITPEEAALYDRQIRLWGIDAQNRIRNANVLIIGMDGAAVEVIKNLVLAGVGSLTLSDKCLVSGSDISFNFFLSHSDLNKQRSMAMVQLVQEMNPRVNIRALEKEASEYQTEKDVDGYDIVCCCGIPFSDLIRINEITHRLKLGFYLIHQHGLYSWSFCDVGVDYSCVMYWIHLLILAISHVTLLREKQQVSSSKSEQKTIQVPVTKNWSMLKDALLDNMWWWPSANHEMSEKKLKRMYSPLFFALQVFYKIEKEGGSGTVDLTDELIFEKRDELMQELKAPVSLLSNEFLKKVFECKNESFVPVSAIVGGIVAQDIIKCISKKGVPLDNILLLDGNSFNGTILSVHPPTLRNEEQ